jgi:hypothetical protein
MRFLLILISTCLLSACALESNTKLTQEQVIEEVVVIKSTKACTDKGTCK